MLILQKKSKSKLTISEEIVLKFVVTKNWVILKVYYLKKSQNDTIKKKIITELLLIS
jgi:hypothetical protein